MDSCTLVAQHGIPVVVTQALDDLSLPANARLMMWHLRLRLDLVTFREIKVASLAMEMRIHEDTASRCLHTLTQRGYLRRTGRQQLGPRAYALPWSRITGGERSAA